MLNWFFRKHKHIYYIYFISRLWNGTGKWNVSPWKTRTTLQKSRMGAGARTWLTFRVLTSQTKISYMANTTKHYCWSDVIRSHDISSWMCHWTSSFLLWKGILFLIGYCFCMKKTWENVSLHWQQGKWQLWANRFMCWMPVLHPGSYSLRQHRRPFLCWAP